MELTSLLPSRTTANRGAPLNLVNPVTGQPIPDGEILVAGFDSDAFREAKNAEAQRRVDAGEKPALADIEEGALRISAALILDWRKVKINGKTPTDNVAALREFPTIKEQVEAFAANRANFPSESSSN